MGSKPATVQAFRVFFPAAAIQAGLVVPLSVFAVASGTGLPAGLLGAGHGHELLFGFALALIAGYTLGPMPRRRLLELFGLWLLARLTYLSWPHSLPGELLSPLFAVALAYHIVPRFSAAKKWRNRIVGPLLLLICLVPLLWLLVPWVDALDQSGLMRFAVLLLALLMSFMGGRIIAPAAAGTLQKQGYTLEARVQPRIEGGLIVTLAGAALSSLALAPVALTAGLLISAAILLLVRLGRWQLWRCRGRPDLLGLGLGYLWLALGTGITGLTMLADKPLAPALHLITIGALGTLAIGVMLRIHTQRLHRQPPPLGHIAPALALIGVAAVARYLAGPAPYAEPVLLWTAATAWALALWLTAFYLLKGAVKTAQAKASSVN